MQHAETAPQQPTARQGPLVQGRPPAALPFPQPWLPRLQLAGWRLPALLACLCWAVALPAHAQWKWRDQNGRINASDRPPPREVQDKDILQRPPAASPPTRRPASDAAASGAADGTRAPAAAASSPLEREVQVRRQQAEAEAAAKAKLEAERTAAQRAENCRNARSQLNALSSGQRIARVNDKGEREVLDDKARAEEMRRAREVMTADCK